LLQAAKKLKDAGTPAAIQIIGDGPLRNSLELLATELKVEAEFLGRCSDERVVEAIEDAGILCLPSHFEGFGIVLAEAMAAGRVVVGADAPGIRDVVPDSRLLFPPDDPEQLAQILSRFIGNPEAQRTVGAELRTKAWESYRLEKTGQQILDVIYRVCRQGVEARVAS
jgi:glycosyltransferase involved in cell wall biosynthesis